MSVAAVAKVISSSRFHWHDEKDLQLGIASVLSSAGLEFTREHRLSDADVIDFLAGNVGVEVKIKGQVRAVQAQLERYALHDSVSELVLVTGRLQLTRMPAKLNGKPLHVVPLMGSLF